MMAAQSDLVETVAIRSATSKNGQGRNDRRTSGCVPVLASAAFAACLTIVRQRVHPLELDSSSAPPQTGQTNPIIDVSVRWLPTFVATARETVTQRLHNITHDFHLLS